MGYKILVLGGYGLFGSLIVKNLLPESNLELIIAGRNLSSAKQFIEDIKDQANCKLTPLAIDATHQELSQKLNKLNLDLVIHTCGPYQHQDYYVAKACIHAGIHYIDLADGREFVSNIHELDSLAKENHCLVISGASSVPGLSSAVAAEYLPEFSVVDEFISYILPGNQTPRGLATIQSILSYVGKPFRVWKKNKWQTVYGWQDLERVELKGLGKRWSGNCDVPDLQLFPKFYPKIKTIRFQAGLELPVLQLGTWLLSWLSRIGLVKNWSHYAKQLKTMSEWLYRFGTDKGGMRVDIKGEDLEGNLLNINWQLIVLDGKGPIIPTIAATLLAKKLSKDEIKITGAKPCINLFSLNEFKETINILNFSNSVYYHEI